MKLKRTIATFIVACSVIAAPITAYAAHSHNWGSSSVYGYTDEKPLPWENKCVTRHVFYYHECLSCGESEVWEDHTIEMDHKMVNNKCIYCGMGYAK